MSHYAFEYTAGIHTTTGDRNRMTGRYSIAGTLYSFPTKLSRNLWVAHGYPVQKHRAKLTKQQALEHQAGYRRDERLDQAIPVTAIEMEIIQCSRYSA